MSALNIHHSQPSIYNWVAPTEILHIHRWHTMGPSRTWAFPCCHCHLIMEHWEQSRSYVFLPWKLQHTLIKNFSTQNALQSQREGGYAEERESQTEMNAVIPLRAERTWDRSLRFNHPLHNKRSYCNHELGYTFPALVFCGTGDQTTHSHSPYTNALTTATAPTLILYFTVHKVSLNSWVGLEYVIILPQPLEKLRLTGPS